MSELTFVPVPSAVNANGSTRAFAGTQTWNVKNDINVSVLPATAKQLLLLVGYVLDPGAITDSNRHTINEHFQWSVGGPTDSLQGWTHNVMQDFTGPGNFHYDVQLASMIVPTLYNHAVGSLQFNLLFTEQSNIDGGLFAPSASELTWIYLGYWK